MHFIALLSLSGVAAASALHISGENTAYLALKSVIERQTICTPVTAPFTCARSCGAGYTECISFPNCYNPGLGQSCCSNGKYCPQGTYCTNAGCCPDGVPLSQCGATITLSVIPPQTSSTKTPTTETSTTKATTSETSTSETTKITLTSTTATTYSVTSTSTSVYSSIHSTSTTRSHTTTSSRHSATGAPTNGTTPYPSPTFVTAGAGKNAIDGLLPAVGGIIALWLTL